MRHKEALIIMKRELRASFTSPVAYIVISIFLVFSGFFFFKDFFYLKQAEMRNFFQLLPLMFAIFVPAMTMRAFSEERQSGSIEILMTMPVTSLDVVLGKFLAATVFVAAALAPTLIYLFTVAAVGRPDAGPLAGGYFGALLLGGASASIGVCASAFTRNQIIAFITALSVNFGLWLVNKITLFLPAKMRFLEYLGTDFHFQNISKGLVDSRDVIYFLSIMALSIMVAVKTIEERRQ
jgi:ABC-2 type transport system permease protein